MIQELSVEIEKVQKELHQLEDQALETAQELSAETEILKELLQLEDQP